MDTSIAIAVIVTVLFVFALPLLARRGDTAAQESQRDTLPETALPVTADVDVRADCGAAGSLPGILTPTARPSLPLSGTAESAPAAHLILGPQTPRLRVVEGDLARGAGVSGGPEQDGAERGVEQPEEQVLPMAVGQGAPIVLETQSGPGESAGAPTGLHIVGSSDIRVHDRMDDHGSIGSTLGPTSSTTAGLDMTMHNAQHRPGTHVTHGPARRPTARTSTPRVDSTAAPARSPATPRAAGLKRMFGLSFAVFGLVALVTAVLSIFTSLLLAVPVLSAALSLSSLLVVDFLNFTADEAPAMSERPAERSVVERPAAQRNAAGRSSGSQRPAPADESSRSAGQDRVRPRAQDRPAAAPESKPRSRAAAGVRTPAQASQAAAVRQARLARAAQTVAAQAPAPRPAETSGAAGPAPTVPQRPDRVPAPVVIGHDEEDTNVIMRRGSAAPGKASPAAAQGSKPAAPVAPDEPEAAPAPAAPELHLGSAWKPAGVPVPTYVNAPEVPRVASAARQADAASYAGGHRDAAAESFVAEVGERAELTDASREDGPLAHGRAAIRGGESKRSSAAVELPATGTSGLGSLDDVLARRRA